ncbi:ubiquinol-cytochrome c reductase iron-sulfur subunit [Nocardia sp. CNY236]|uniref:QcrA and Rieske domain-containing protein n=1 Tax=Nocardia sp. CNY236 TaxID=1169152 RepID=UPI0004101ED8|nr:Rieske (2Fe-2S) protein [Nocardia sp. CNY236]
MTFERTHTRRGVVIAGTSAVTAAALTACATYGKDTAAPADAAPGSDGDRAAGGAPTATTLAKTTDIPVGGGVIIGNTVVTQPSAGTFVGLSSTCTHAGCTVATVSDGTINCPCHNSQFGLDGSVAKGPATKPLAEKRIRVQGDAIIAE